MSERGGTAVEKAAWMLERSAYQPGVAEVLALRCVQEAAGDGDEPALAYWSAVSDAIETLRWARLPGRETMH